MNRNLIRERQEKQTEIDSLIRQADEMIRIVRAVERSHAMNMVENSEKGTLFYRLQIIPGSLEERHKIGYAGKLKLSVLTHEERLSKYEEDRYSMPMREPYQPHYPRSAESFVKELYRDVERIQQRTSAPRMTSLVVDREDRYSQQILHGDDMLFKWNAIAQSQMYGKVSCYTPKKEVRRVAIKQKKGNISELSEQIDLTVESLKNQLQEHDTFTKERDVSNRIQFLLLEDKKLEEQRRKERGK